MRRSIKAVLALAAVGALLISTGCSRTAELEARVAELEQENASLQEQAQQASDALDEATEAKTDLEDQVERARDHLKDAEIHLGMLIADTYFLDSAAGIGIRNAAEFALTAVEDAAGELE